MSTPLPFEVDFVERDLVEVNFNVIDTIPPIVRNIDDLEDVDIDNIQDKQYLRYNSSTQKWENVTLETIIEVNTVFNELPTKLSVTKFETEYDFMPSTLVVHLNGIKERYITVTAINQFDFNINTEGDDIVEVSYIRT